MIQCFLYVFDSSLVKLQSLSVHFRHYFEFMPLLTPLLRPVISAYVHHFQ